VEQEHARHSRDGARRGGQTTSICSARGLLTLRRRPPSLTGG